MESDDIQIGRLLSRREALLLLGASGAAVLTGCTPSNGAATHGASGQAGPSSSLPACVVRPEQTEGPYFVDEKLNRADIRTDPTNGAAKAGTPLVLVFNVSRISGGSCSPLAGAQVDVWQCDAMGVYSDARDPSFNTIGQKFLRGYQVTDAKGVARFTTIYPGWYQGRTVHIHFKIRTDPAASRGYDFTSQVYFDDTLTDRVHAAEPYATKGQGRTRNGGDGIFRRGGEQLMIPVAESQGGYTGTFDVGLQIG